MDQDPTTGRWTIPELAVFWSVRDASGQTVLLLADPTWAWHGHRESLPGSVLVTEFNPLNGAGTADFAVPIGTHSSLAVYPGFSPGITTLRFAFGPRASMGIDENGLPKLAKWEGEYVLTTAVPSLWLQVVDSGRRVGEWISMRLVLPHTSPLDRHFLIESQGVGVVEGDTGTDPCYTLDAGTQGLEFSVRAVRPGIFRVKIIDVASGGWAMSQYSEVMGSGSVLTISSEPWQPDPESLPEEEQPWDPPTGESGDYPERECIPARSAPGTGPRLEGCTGCFKLTPGTPPPNPNCGSPTKGLFFPAKCIDSMDWYCEWDGTESIDATRYDYDGIMLLPCGSDTVEVTASYAPLGLGGGATWSSTTAKMQLCCVYKEVQNTTTKIKVKKCRSFL